MGMLRDWRWKVAYLGVLVRSCAVRLVFCSCGKVWNGCVREGRSERVRESGGVWGDQVRDTVMGGSYRWGDFQRVSW